jgi:thioredoxin-like negative regulator of GroEL
MRTTKLVILIVAALSIVVSCAQKEEGIRWVGSLEEALAQAKESDRHVLVEFYTRTCKWCVALAETTFADSAVIAFSGDFLWAKVDANEDTMATKRHRVFGYPTTILLDPSGEEIDRIVGYLPPEPFLAEIQGYLAGRGTLAAMLEQVSAAPQDVQLKFQLGEKYHQRGLWEESLAVFEEVVRLDPENGAGLADDAMIHQGEALRRLKRIDEAVARFRQLQERFPESEMATDAELEIGYTYQNARRTDEAVAVYEDFLHQYPDHQYVDWIKRQLEELAGGS